VALSTFIIREENILLSINLIIQFVRIIFIFACKCTFCFSSSLISLSSASRPKDAVFTLCISTAYVFRYIFAKNAILVVQLVFCSSAALSDSLAMCRIIFSLASLLTARTLRSAGEASSFYEIFARRTSLVCFLMLLASSDYGILTKICLLMRADSFRGSHANRWAFARCWLGAPAAAALA
jgi:hypothetical protein